MPRYIVQRTFPDGLLIPVGDGGADVCHAVIERNSDEGVTWIHSYVSEDKRTTFCVYDAPNEALVREHAAKFGGHVISRLYEIADEVTPAVVRQRAGL